jgi:N utilization substance protein B
MARRSRAREVAFQVLYQDDLNPRNNPAVGDQLIAQRLRADDLIGFARGLVAGVRQHREEVDRVLQATAANWSLKRMAATDRNVLRLAAYEILHGDTPGRVAIDEAVELAKRFGSAQSAQFVNGILDKVMHGKEASTESNSPEPPPPDVGAAVVLPPRDSSTTAAPTQEPNSSEPPGPEIPKSPNPLIP